MDTLRASSGARIDARAATLHLIALRTSRDIPDTEYKLACDFAMWGQKKLAVEYLQKSADHGYWGYRVMTQDTDLDSIKDDPAYTAALAKVKTSFATESAKHAPGMTVKPPAGA